GNYNNDNQLNTDDLDLLVEAITTQGDLSSFDLNGDGTLDTDDLQSWLAIAGDAHLPNGAAYLLGDANLDGKVDGQDFVAWNEHKFTTLATWSGGDFNADGLVDGDDFLILDANLFRDAREPLAVPEPVVPVGWGVMVGALWTAMVRNRCRKSF
ncbi:MAG: hypothetical protein AAGF97_15280, partial [Planctomycetota bacterium]